MSDRTASGGLGALPPDVRTEIPGPESRRLGARIAEVEAPGINTVYRGEAGLFWQQAAGANVVDVDGNRFVDLTSGFGVAAIGHRHPKVVEAVTRQSHTLVHGLGDVMAHPERLELSSRLAELVPVRRPAGQSAQVHLAVSGSDALEIATKTALLRFSNRHSSHEHDRQSLLVFDPAYHGLSLGALALTSRPAFREPFARHLHPHLERRPFGCDPGELEGLFESGRLAAAIVEPVVGREGVVVPPAGWLEGLARLCRRTDTLLVADEIFTGFGRTGRLLAVEHELAGDLLPDLVCCGKALAGGLPIGAVVGRRELMAAWSTPGEALHTGTFVGHPLACAAANACLDVLLDPSDPLAERAAALGDEVAERLAAWHGRFGHHMEGGPEEVRGRGLLWGVVFRSARAAAEWTTAARQRGILLLAGGPEGRVAQLVPPLTIDRDLLHFTLDILEGLFDPT